ncbi:Uncharacterised protein [Legionella beliardensis]|uniref:Uncharacterized protein n=1 Tax=Legionella beliardensis TaxID=91822 RepID=A0A378HYN7_9GAMM|nr:hypothetical protein [Legionella beliardensis]STX27590.1 Uncharacterised protein [Legionella beliardensis]
MSTHFESLKNWIAEMADLIGDNSDPDPQYFKPFLHEPILALQLVDLIASLNEEAANQENPYYSACIFAIDICVAQLQSAQETGNKLAMKTLNQLMEHMANAIRTSNHSLGFWLPILNAFYDVHIELSPKLRDAYLALAEVDDDSSDSNDDIHHLDAIRDMIDELSNFSAFDIAENFFAQSHAMPADFFVDLVIDLYSIEEGHEIALLTLLHPKPTVREIVIATFEHLIHRIALSPTSLSRLQTIKNWYPAAYHEQFNRWIKLQRKQGVIFDTDRSLSIVGIKASEVDGSGAQGVFIHIKHGRTNRLCGLLYKYGLGIKDAWLTPPITLKDVKKYYDETFDDSIVLRDIDTTYLQAITEHFLALTIEQGGMPDLHLLEIQELLGINFYPHALDIPALIEELSIQITPFTPDKMQSSLKRSKNWLETKPFTESWYVENANVDKLVNRCSNFVDGVKFCNIEDAVTAVLEQEMEVNREKWLFHFLWITLWLKAKTRKNEKTWQDSFFIAYAIYEDIPLSFIPLMHEISRQTVINSIETMHDRRTYLNKE